MIEIKPNIQHQSNCPYCQNSLKPINVKWQGMYIYVESICSKCSTELIENLKISHLIHKYFQIDVEKSQFWWEGTAIDHAKILLNSLNHPESDQLEIKKELFKPSKQVIILNCIDHLYGHCLLKLLNAQRYLDSYPDYGLIIIIPKFMRWMVPEGVAEVWTVPIPLSKSFCYYPSFAEFVTEELKRFDQVYVSKAYSHPSQFDITRFTRVPKHSFDQADFNITFIWREDRMWFGDENRLNQLIFRVLRKIKMLKPILFLQNWRVRRLLAKIKTKVPSATFVVAGLGTQTKFPTWIEDLRVKQFEEKTEKQMCKVYADSRLVIGIHGSNMLLPSGHAGMTLDLMPDARWNNFAQDILYQETDPRLASFRYRYLPLHTNIERIADIASSMLLQRPEFYSQMTSDR